MYCSVYVISFQNNNLTMASHREWDLDCKVYIGGLSEDANKYDHFKVNSNFIVHYCIGLT